MEYHDKTLPQETPPASWQQGTQGAAQQTPPAQDTAQQTFHQQAYQQPILECRGLYKEYDKQQTALNGISFGVGQGRILGLLGPNGSGKTTLIKLAAGLLMPTRGEILIGGRPPGVDSKRIVSYLPDRNFLDGAMTFKEACGMFRTFYADFDENRAMRMLSDLGVSPVQRFKTLSKGNREKVQLILVMSRQAWLYLLDEPIAGVDPATRDYILHTIISNRPAQATVIISTHLIADVEGVLDDVLFLKSGMVALYNSAENVRKENGKSIDEIFREVYAFHPSQGGGW